MSIPVWILLGFAAWTLITLLVPIGCYRWSRILTGRAEIKDFRADEPHGSDWYRRAIRAHANCLENLPLYTAIVVAIVAAGIRSSALDTLAMIFLVARICQTVAHITLAPTNLAASIRFIFFSIQIVCMLWMGLIVALSV
ncbi:MAG: MAPEG family protein [Candidatus Binatia bacterium]